MTKRMIDAELKARDAKRDIAGELLAAVRDLKAGRWARKTTFKVMAGGRVRRRIERADGSIEKDEVLTGPKWELMAARYPDTLERLREQEV
jgi:putative transcriptional regulator